MIMEWSDPKMQFRKGVWSANIGKGNLLSSKYSKFIWINKCLQQKLIAGYMAYIFIDEMKKFIFREVSGNSS